MDRLTAFQTFVEAVDSGSVNRASKRVKISQSAASQQIQALERFFDQELLQRSPSGVRVTEAGQVVYDHAQEILGNYGGLLNAMNSRKGRVQGVVRVSMGSFLGRLTTGPALISLKQRHPDLEPMIHLEDRFVDILNEPYDLLLRTGKLGESGGVARKIASINTALFATPEYLEQHGHPKEPEDLKKLRFIRFSDDPNASRLPILKDGAKQIIDVPVGMTVGSPDLIQRAVFDGMGFSRAPLAVVSEALAAGRIVELLPGYQVAPKDMFLIYRSKQAMDFTPAHRCAQPLGGAGGNRRGAARFQFSQRQLKQALICMFVGECTHIF